MHSSFEITITPPKSILNLQFGEVWRYRDLKVRYKQTLIGVAWAISLASQSD